MTYLQIVNRVLLRLREDAVTSVSETDYSKLIGDFVKQALSEVEDAWDWNVLRTTIQITTAADDFSYSLTGAGVSYRIFDVHEDNEDYDLVKAPYHQMNHWLLSNSTSTDRPMYWDINGVGGDGSPVVNFYPVPDGEYKVNFNMKVKTDLSGDSDGTTTILVSSEPVMLRALSLAMDERGDDQGMSLEYVENQYQKALGNAILYDAALHADEQVWEVE